MKNKNTNTNQKLRNIQKKKSTIILQQQQNMQLT